jgi:hypothetical protein
MIEQIPTAEQNATATPSLLRMRALSLVECAVTAAAKAVERGDMTGAQMYTEVAKEATYIAQIV